MSDLSRLSDMNIEDDVLRAAYYQRVNEYINSTDSSLSEYDLKEDEEYRPDLVSYRIYGTVELGWLVCLVCDLDDVAEPLPIGETIYLPEAAWVRRSMRQFMDELGL
ncbi:hypothetical protein K6U51_11825 [Vibrio fluvialis]|uniref:hypothetical protein n=1 Tax=Vibrio fluvialis TaxID=676 RepID=UPI001EEB10B0|nr:hypothetical protein [Vibrio fluvialis]MCG6387514.1 hypothetical protein [Vibrio fluvialis]MCG6418727.1 hypothetical protein [Vibrio fluvialis]